MRSCQCTNCGANLIFDDNNREFGFCQYCGTKIMLDDYRCTHHVIDEARIKEAEIEQIIRLKELEIEKRDRETSRKEKYVGFGIALLFVIVGGFIYFIIPMVGIAGVIIGAYIALFTFISGNSNEQKYKDARMARTGMIKLSYNVIEYKKKDFRSLQIAYTGLGFTNVTTVNLQDLKIGLIKKSGLVESVIIDGEIPNIDKWYNPNANVVITYHGFIKDN